MHFARGSMKLYLGWGVLTQQRKRLAGRSSRGRVENMQPSISGSVGHAGRNMPQDIGVVQTLLNQNSNRMTGFQQLRVDRAVGPKTIGAIRLFQQQVVRLGSPDGRVDVGGRTWQSLVSGNGAPGASPAPGMPVPIVPPSPSVPAPGGYTYYSHPNAANVTLAYGERAVRMVPNAEFLLKSILGSCNILSATLTSTLRTYHDQARITMEQTYPASPAKVTQWYGNAVRVECEKYLKTHDIQGFADWWEAYDKQRGAVSSLHLTNQALDVVPIKDREKFAKAVGDLVPVAGSGVRRIIPKGVMGEPVDHVEFTFKVCPA